MFVLAGGFSVSPTFNAICRNAMLLTAYDLRWNKSCLFATDIQTCSSAFVCYNSIVQKRNQIFTSFLRNISFSNFVTISFLLELKLQQAPWDGEFCVCCIIQTHKEDCTKKFPKPLVKFLLISLSVLHNSFLKIFIRTRVQAVERKQIIPHVLL